MLHEIESIHKNISCFIKETPLTRFKELEQLCELEFPVFLKGENFQVTQSFKIRGAAQVLLKLTPEERKRGVISRSSGNFGQALAYLTEKMGIKCTLVLPKNVPPYKLKLTQQFKPEIILHGTTHQEMNEKVAELVNRYNYVKLTSFDDLNLIKGQGTCGYEITQQNPRIQHIFIPIGGGGLSAGMSAALKEFDPQKKVYVVEPEGANDYFLSRKRGQKVTLTEIDTVADGLRAPCVGVANWPLLEKNVDEALVVSEKEIISAMKLIWDHLNYKIEPSGAVGIAALIRYRKTLDLQGPIAIVISGGNIEDSYFDSLLEDSLAST